MLASHGDGTFTIKYSDGQAEDDVPKTCMRPTASRRGGRRGKRNPSHEDRRDK